MKNHRVVVSGSLAYDRIMDFPGRFRDHLIPDKMHVLSVSFFLRDLKEHFGGTAGNIAYTLSLLRIRTTIAAAAGKDFAPYRRWLQQHRIRLDAVAEFSDCPTAVANIMTDRDDNQLTGFYAGALLKPFSPAVIAKAFHNRPKFVLLAPSGIQATLAVARRAVAQRIPYMFDPGQQLPAFSTAQFKTLITNAAMFISNDYELSLALSKLGWSQAKLLRTVPMVITTLGPKGSRLFAGDVQYRITVAKVANTDDPTGAGDAYRAGFLAGYVRGLPIRTCGRMGAVAAAYTVERPGTQTHAFTVNQFIQRYRKNFYEQLPL